MNHPQAVRRILAALILSSVAVSVGAQEPEAKFTNLKVLPKDISPADLHATMSGFTRALGVRCGYCHVSQPGQPMRPEDFAKDDKPTKAKARLMMKMVADLNDNYLAKLESRAEPPIKVQCATCHRGISQPRMLQDVLKVAYDKGGMDSTVARYQALRDRYYGSAAYDFGEVPLADVATQVRAGGHAQDAAHLLSLNVEMNPKSAFAKRQYAGAAIAEAFRTAGADSGAATYRALKDQYGDKVVSEELMNDVGYTLLGSGQTAPAIAVFKLGVAEHPASVNAYDSLGEAYEQLGDRKLAAQAYAKVVELEPTNEHAKQKLVELKSKPKKAKK